MSKIKKMIFIALIDAIATQVFVSLFPGGFRISLSVAILPVFYYFDDELNPLTTAFFISTIGLIFRALVNVNAIILDSSFYFKDLNIIVFDFIYALIFFYFYYRKKDKQIFNWLMIVFFADLFANISELISRQISVIVNLNELIVVAFVRALISVLMVIMFYYFMSVFKKEIDRKKYYDLLGIFSDIQSEVYLMNNNIKYIENVMTDAYMLYDDIENENLYQNKKQALKIAQNVHEIKKNYLGILSGLSSVKLNDSIHDNMTFYKILDVLEKSANNFIIDNNGKISLEIVKNGNFNVAKHYYIMSILRNLVNNSIESLLKCNKINKKITIKYNFDDKYLYLNVYDNGCGIKEKNIEYVFNSGFSTKFTNDGKIHRGLGLTLIKDIIESEFKGNIEIQSNYRRFTRITVKLKLNHLKGENDEFLYYRRWY